MTSYTFITNLSTTSPLLRWLFGFALCFEVFLPFDLLGQYFLFLTTMPFFHGATEFLYKKLWFIIPKRLVLYFFFLSKSWLICLLQLPILRVQFIPPSLVSLIDFLYFLKQILLEYFELPWGLSHKESICNAGHKVPSLSQDDLLKKEMATHSGILAWEIPETKEPSGLHSMRFQKSQKRLSN